MKKYFSDEILAINKKAKLVVFATFLLIVALGFIIKRPGDERTVSQQSKATTAKPTLTVALIKPQINKWPVVLSAAGNIAPWHEVVIGAEISNSRLTEVLVDVGDRVQKGSVLAHIANEIVEAELRQARAAVSEIEAVFNEAKANATRARQLQTSGFYSAQLAHQYITAEQSALARLDAAKAKMQSNQLRLAQTIIRAPDSGIISACTATVGALTQPGQELFRLISSGRLEWRAEVTASDLLKIKPGVAVTLLSIPKGEKESGRVRMVAPTVNTQTRNGLVYVDISPSTYKNVRAGMFLRGEFELGQASALSLPQTAVLHRDGYSYVFRMEGENRVVLTKVSVGRRLDDRIEITGGIDAQTGVVEAGVGFLADGDAVRVVDSLRIEKNT